MSNQGEYPEDGQKHDFSLSRRDLIKVSAAAAATAAVYPCGALAEGEPAVTPAPEILPLTLRVNGKSQQLDVDTRTTAGCAAREYAAYRHQKRL